MTIAEHVRKRIGPLPVSVLFFSLFVAPAAFSERATVTPSVAPGAYNSPQAVSFSVPSSARLLVGVDGTVPVETSGPLLLTVPYGSVKTYSVEAIAFPLDPTATGSVSSRFSWTIDRAPPSAPVCDEKRADNGWYVTLRADAGDTVHWKMFHPVYGSNASGEGLTPERVFVPDGATLCAYAVDAAGNRGKTVSIDKNAPSGNGYQCRIVSPVPGTWANPQALVIESSPDMDVSYTTDGSDPSREGIPYRGPSILSDTSIREVRVRAVSRDGSVFSDTVKYSVASSPTLPSGTSPVRDLRADVPLVDVGDFLELHTAQGFLCSPGNSVASESASDRIVLSSVRGIRTWQPMTVTDGTSFWRWVFVLGPTGSGDVPATVTPVQAEASDRPEVTVNDWYFVDVYWKDPVYVSLDGGAWATCIEPVFVDRSSSHSLSWYSGTWKNGEVQRLSLPAKPSLSGIPSQGLTADPVFLSCDGSPFTFRYEGGYFVPANPSEASPSLSSGLLVEIANGSETRFSFTFRASLDGIDHGTLSAFFVMDRKAPRTPSAGIPDSLVYSRESVVITPSGEDMIQVSVKGEPFSHDGKAFTLAGDPSRSIDYTVTLFAVDRAGNRSPVRERQVTVDLNALYVNPSATVSATRDGSPDSPFLTVDDALQAMHGQSSWRIELSGDAGLSASHTIRNDVSIRANGHTLSVAPSVSLTVIRCALSIADCTLDFADSSRAGEALMPLAFPAASPLQLDGATLSLERCAITCSLPASGSFLRAKGSRVSFTSSSVALSSREYAILIDATRCAVGVRSSSLSVSARDAVGVSLNDSTAAFSGSSVTVSASSAGRAIEAWSSTLSLARVTLARTVAGSSAANRDTAVWLDGSSRVTDESGLVVSGFANARGTVRVR